MTSVAKTNRAFPPGPFQVLFIHTMTGKPVKSGNTNKALSTGVTRAAVALGLCNEGMKYNINMSVMRRMHATFAYNRHVAKAGNDENYVLSDMQFYEQLSAAMGTSARVLQGAYILRADAIMPDAARGNVLLSATARDATTAAAKSDNLVASGTVRASSPPPSTSRSHMRRRLV